MTKDMTSSLRRAVSDSNTRSRKDKHVSRACNQCRRKKSKCDGVQPRCTTCESTNSPECTWAQEEDGRRPATKGQVDAMQLKIRTLETDNERQQAIIDRLKAQLGHLNILPDLGPLQPGGGSPIIGGSPTHINTPYAPHSRSSSLSITIPSAGLHGMHGRSHSEGGGLLGVPGGSPNRSPISTASSLPSPNVGGSNHFLTVPSPIGNFRGGSPSPSDLSYAATDTDDERGSAGALSDGDGEDEALMAPFASNLKRMVINDNDDLMAVQGHSPLALSCSPPHTPARSRAGSVRGSFSNNQVGSGSFGSFRFPQSPSSAPVGLGHVQSPPATTPSGLGNLLQEPQPIHDLECPCDWARHLPQELRSLVTRSEHDKVLDEYLRAGASFGMVIIRGYFLRDMRIALGASDPGSVPPSKLLYYSPALHNAILADAGAFADPGTLLSRPEARALLARTARELAEQESLSSAAHQRSGSASEHSAAAGASPLPAVQAFAILSRYHLARPGAARLAYAVFGMAARTALSLGLNMNLHADSGPVSSSGERVLHAGFIGDSLDIEERNARDWLFWSLFCQDVDISLHVGQERSLSANSNVPLPPLPVTSQETPSTSAAFVFEATVPLMKIASRMMDEQATLSAKGSNAARLVSAIQDQLANWHATLPDPLMLGRTSASAAPGPVLLLHCAHWWITILLHREFYTGFIDSEKSAKYVDDASKKILRTMTTYVKLNGPDRAPLSSVAMVFAAGAAALMRADATPQSAHKKCREALDAAADAVKQLRQLAKPWPCCDAYATAIEERWKILDRSRRTHSPNSSVTIHTPSHEHRHSVPAVVIEPTDPTGTQAALFPGLFNPFGGPNLSASDAAMQDWVASQPIFTGPTPTDFSLGPLPGTVTPPNLGASMLFGAPNPDAGDGQAMFTQPSPERYHSVLSSSPQSVSSMQTFMGNNAQQQRPFITSSPTGATSPFQTASPTPNSPFMNSSPTQMTEPQLGPGPVYGFPHTQHHLHHHHGHPGHGGHAHHQSSGSMSDSFDVPMSGSSLSGSMSGSMPISIAAQHGHHLPHHDSTGSMSAGSMSQDGVWSSGSWSQSQ